MNVGRGCGATDEALLLERLFLCTHSGQMSPCPTSDLGGLILSCLWAARVPLVLGRDVNRHGSGKLLPAAAHEG